MTAGEGKKKPILTPCANQIGNTNAGVNIVKGSVSGGWYQTR